MIKFFTQNIGKYKLATIASPVFVILEVFCEILIPFITANIVDEGILQGNIDAVFFHGVIMIGVALLALACGILAGCCSAIAGAGFAANLRVRIFEKIQKFAFSNIDKFSASGLITRMTTDVTNVQNAFQMLIRVCVRAPFMLICSIIMCFLINVKMSLIFTAALTILAITLGLIIYKINPIFKKVLKAYDDLNASTQENITSIRVVKGFAREEFEREKFGKAALLLCNFSIAAEKLIALNMPILLTVIFACMMGLGWFGSNFIVMGEMTAGNLTSMFSYVMSMMMSLMMISFVFVMVSMSLASIDRINAVLNERPAQKEPMDKGNDPVISVSDGAVDFKDVNFAYAQGMGIVTLRDINIHIDSGQTIGLIGATGSGKSTFVNLISRLYDVNTGSVCVGGVNVKDYDSKILRQQVSVVLQDNVLFSGTILDNLRWGNPEATLEECKEACKLSCILDFIDKQPYGFDTHIEQGGTNVSGGQRQRLCIARALLKKPKVLILDDSTSAVDTATDAKIRKSFKTKIPGTTKIIISQRVSSVQDSDKIIVLDAGRINAFDTHENLLTNNDIYREIHDVQMQSGGDFDEKINAD